MPTDKRGGSDRHEIHIDLRKSASRVKMKVCQRFPTADPLCGPTGTCEPGLNLNQVHTHFITNAEYGGRVRKLPGRRSAIFYPGKDIMDWRHHAACLTEDPELFFPIGDTGPALQQIEAAKNVCHRCEVMDTCLRYTLENGIDAGVWGGRSEDERRALRRRATRARRAA